MVMWYSGNKMNLFIHFPQSNEKSYQPNRQHTNVYKPINVKFRQTQQMLVTLTG